MKFVDILKIFQVFKDYGEYLTLWREKSKNIFDKIQIRMDDRAGAR